jgi:hypothetical protein
MGCVRLVSLGVPVIPLRFVRGPLAPDARLCQGIALVAVIASLSGCTDRGEKLTGGGGESLRPFASAQTCGSCHPQHLEEWEASMHAFGGVDPLMLAMAELARQEPGEQVGDDCLPCHAPALVRQEQWLASLPDGENPEIEDLSLDGINCDVCHSVQIVPPVGSIDFLQDVDPDSPKLGGLRDPAPNDFHESLHDDSYTTSIQCAPCHQVNLNDGTGIENTFTEWQNAIGSGMGEECQACHMPAYTGSAAVGEQPRPHLHRHWFTGVGYALEEFRGVDRVAQLERIDTLLKSAVRVDPAFPPQGTAGSPLAFSVTVTNHRTGHAIPSGTSFTREMWLDVTVKDATGAVLHRSGALGAEGDLVREADLAFFGSQLLDANGQPTFFTWRAESIDETGLLQFGQARESSYSLVVPAGAMGPLTIDVALRFRPLPPELLRMLDLEELRDPQWEDEGGIVVFTMWETSQIVPLVY